MPFLSGVRRATLLSGSASLAAPVLATLYPAKSTFTTAATPGTVIWSAGNKVAGSTLTFAPNDGRIAVDGSGQLVVGLSASSVGTINGTITESIAGYTKQSPIAITVTAAAVAPTLQTRPVITGTPLSGEILTAYTGNLGAGSGQWLRNGSAITGQTGTQYTATDADLDAVLAYQYTPSGGSAVTSPNVDPIQQSIVFMDESGNVLVTETGASLTPGYNYGLTLFLDEAGNNLTDESGANLGDFDYTAVTASAVRMVAPYSASVNTFNQLSNTDNPFTFAVSDTDKITLASANVPFQCYAPNMVLVQVWCGGAIIAQFTNPDSLGYFTGTLNLSSYANGPRYFEVRAYNRSTPASALTAIFAGYHLYLTGGSETDTSAMPVGAAGLALQFQDDFTNLSVSRSATNDGARWYDQMPDNKNFGDQIFTAASSPQNPFNITGSFLRIRLQNDQNFAGGQSGLKHWYGGLLSAAFPDGTTNVPTGKGYYEARILIPFGSGTWPAFWLLDLDKVKDTSRTYSHREIDILEQYNTQITQYTATTHRYAIGTGSDTPTSKRVVTPDQRWEFHRIGVRVTDTQINYYFDDTLVFADTYFQTTSPNESKNYILLNHALTGGPNNSPETIPPSNYYDMYVDYVKYYA